MKDMYSAFAQYERLQLQEQLRLVDTSAKEVSKLDHDLEAHLFVKENISIFSAPAPLPFEPQSPEDVSALVTYSSDGGRL